MDHHGFPRNDIPSLQGNASGRVDNNGNAPVDSSGIQRSQVSRQESETVALVDSIVEPISASMESGTHGKEILPNRLPSAPMKLIASYTQVSDEDCDDVEGGSFTTGTAVGSHSNNEALASTGSSISEILMDQSPNVSATTGETAATVGNTILRAVGATFRRRDPSIDDSEGTDSSEAVGASPNSIWEEATNMESFVEDDGRGVPRESDRSQLVPRKGPIRHTTTKSHDAPTDHSAEQIDVVNSELGALKTSPMAAAASAVASVIAGVKGGTDSKDAERVPPANLKASTEVVDQGDEADSDKDEEFTRRTRNDFGASRYDYDMNWDLIGRKGANGGKQESVGSDDEDLEDIPILGHPAPPPDSDSDGMGDSTEALEDTGQGQTSQQSTLHFMPRRRARSSPTPSGSNVKAAMGSDRQNLVHGTEPNVLLESVFSGIRQPAPPFALDERFRDVSRIGRTSHRFDNDHDESLNDIVPTPFREEQNGASGTRSADALSERSDSLNTEASHSSSATIPTMHRRRRTASRGNGTFTSPHVTYRSGVTQRSRQRSFSTVEGSAHDRHRLSQQTMRRTAHGVADVFGSAGDDVGISERSPGSRSLLASLDAGMATLRRWARSQSREGVATRMGSRSSWAASSSLQLGNEDLFALSYAGSGSSSQFEASSIGGSDNRTIFGGSEAGANLAGRGPLYPPPIQEEDEAHRQRAHSEPDGLGIRDFLFGTGRIGRRNQNQGPSSQTSAQRRRQWQGSRRSADGNTSGSDTGSSSWRPPSFLPSMGNRRPGGHGFARAHSLSSPGNPQSIFQSESHSEDVGNGPTIELEVFDAASSRTSSERTPPLSRAFRDETTSQMSRDGVAVRNDEDQLSTVDSNGVAASEARGNGAAQSTSSQSTGVGRGTGVSTFSDTTRLARSRWLRINRRFQLTITIVAVLFSLILFAILVSWVILTSAYVIAIEKRCDVPLKMYFWLATFQLILDVFRSDIMRLIFRWDANSRERMPSRVIVYNLAYLTYAMVVLRLGVRSVFLTEGSTCRETASELFQASTVFVCLSLAAWATIVFGYLVPFCCVAIILSRNGYSPAADITAREGTFGAAGGFVGGGGVFPTAYTPVGAPPETIDQLRVVLVEEFPDSYPRDCCICMADFVPGEVVVATECEHVFHKRCFQEWLRQARTCPVCRTDIPSGLGGGGASVVENAGNAALDTSTLATVGRTVASADVAAEGNDSSTRSRRDGMQEGVSGWLNRFRHVDGSLESTRRTTRASPGGRRTMTTGAESTSPTLASSGNRRHTSGANGRSTTHVNVHVAAEEGRAIGGRS